MWRWERSQGLNFSLSLSFSLSSLFLSHTKPQTGLFELLSVKQLIKKKEGFLLVMWWKTELWCMYVNEVFTSAPALSRLQEIGPIEGRPKSFPVSSQSLILLNSLQQQRSREEAWHVRKVPERSKHNTVSRSEKRRRKGGGVSQVILSYPGGITHPTKSQVESNC